MIKADIKINYDNDLISCRKIKDKMSLVPEQGIDYYMDSNNDVISSEKMLYKMPDDSIISVPKKARLLSSELLFKY